MALIEKQQSVGTFLLNVALGRNGYSFLIWLAVAVFSPWAVFTQDPQVIDWALISCWVMAVCILITGFVTRAEAQQSHHWPQIEVTDLRVSKVAGPKGKMLPQISCSFEVDGHSYKGTQYDLSDSRPSLAETDRIITEIKALDGRAWLYYNPENPNMNIIHPGVRLVHYVRILLGVAALIIVPLFFFDVIILPD